MMGFLWKIAADKELRKKISVAIQAILLGLAALWMILQFLDMGSPPRFQRDRWTQRDGFMAISYRSLTRDADSGLNHVGQFDEHLSALTAAGYNPITMDDVIDFYKGKPLPEKAVFIMFEGGRRDSAIFGQKSLSRVSGHAAFFTYTDTMMRREDFFVTPRQVNAIFGSDFWDVGSQGYRLSTLPNPRVHNRVTYFLCDFLRDELGEAIESPEEMEARLTEFYRLSFEPLDEVTGGALRAFVFPPANSWYDMPVEVEAVNRRLSEQYFGLSFTREGAAFNAEGEDVYALTRLQVDPGWSAPDLIAELEKAERRLAAYSAAVNHPGAWLSYRSEVAVADGAIYYTPAELDGTSIPAFLNGSQSWGNIDLSMEMERDINARMLYLRYSSKYSFLRVTLAANRLQVHERVPGLGLELIFDRALPTQAEPWRLRFVLLGRRLQIMLNGAALPDGLIPVHENLRQGRLGLAANSAAVFGGFTVRSLPPLWADLKVTGLGGFGPEEIVESVIITLPQKEDTDRALRELMQSVQKGGRAVAALPAGELAFDEERLFLPPLDPGAAKRLWGGVLVSPGAGADWSAVAETLAAIRKAGYSPALRLNLAAAVSLVNSGLTMAAEHFVLDFSGAGLPLEQWIQLANRHNRNRFLWPSCAPGARDGLYAVRRQR